MQRLTIRVIPNSKANKIIGYEAGAWKIRLTAPAIEGRANKALIEFLSDTLNCSKSEIQILTGLTSHKKIVTVPDYVDRFLGLSHLDAERGASEY